MADKDKERSVTDPELDRHAYEREATTDLKDQTPDRPKGIPLHTRILIGLAVGVVAGVYPATRAAKLSPARASPIISNSTTPRTATAC